jgi:hypothetical protein
LQYLDNNDSLDALLSEDENQQITDSIRRHFLDREDGLRSILTLVITIANLLSLVKFRLSESHRAHRDRCFSNNRPIRGSSRTSYDQLTLSDIGYELFTIFQS